MTVAVLLAHQGGWDEALFVLAPLAVFAGLLLVARRRVDQMESSEQAETTGDDAEPAETSPDRADSDGDVRGTT